MFNRLQTIDIEKDINQLNPLFVRALEDAGFRSIKLIRDCIEECREGVK
jgi:hypothetical protein